MAGGFGGVLVLAAADYRGPRGRSRWMTARRAGLGASDTAAVLGLNPYRTALDVWLDKTSTGDPVENGSEATEWGQLLESLVARRTVKVHPELGKLVPTPGLLAHPEFPWLLATVDFGLAARGRKDAPVRALLEVKTTSVSAYRRHWTDGPPAWVQVQCQQQMAVTGLDECWVTCAVGGDAGPMKLAEPYRVARSPRVIGQIIGYVGAWWAHHIIEGVRPDPVFADADKLPALFPGDEGLEPLTATDTVSAALAAVVDARARAKAAAMDEKQAKFTLKLAMGSRTRIQDADGTVLATWKPQTVRRLNQEKLAAEHPALVEQYREARTGPGPLLVMKEDA